MGVDDTARPPAARSGRRASRRDLSAGYRRALGLTTLGTIIPGAGLTRARSRVLGWLLVLIALLTAGAAAYLVATHGVKGAGLYVLGKTAYLPYVAAGLAVGGLVWCASIVATAIQTRPHSLDRSRTRVLAIVTTLLVGLVGGLSYKGTEYALIGNDSLNSIFSSTQKPGQGAQVVDGEDPWAKTPRVNILLLGSDAGVDRTGTRTDSMVVASIDTATGNTALISLPRNLEQAPLAPDSELRKVYPSGIYGDPVCKRLQRQIAAGEPKSDYCLLNAIWTEADELKAADPTAYPGDAVPGRTEIRKTISQIVGLTIDQTVIVDLKGFQELINAMGGVEVNIKLGGPNNDIPLPYGKAYANGTYSGYFRTPGPTHLDGYLALWYARTRAADSDDSRQERQRCVIKAVVNQVDPVTMVAAYPEIARIAKENIWTDIPRDNLPAFVQLVERVQKAKMTSVPLTTAAGIHPGNPDYELLREKVQAAIAPKPTPAATPAPSTPGSTSTTSPTESPSTSTPTGGSTTPTTPAAEVDECA